MGKADKDLIYTSGLGPALDVVILWKINTRPRRFGELNEALGPRGDWGEKHMATILAACRKKSRAA